MWFCAVAGDLTSYTLGRRLGRGFLERHGPRLKITEERLQTVEGFFDRHGGPTILIGRFIGLVRALAPFIAGASKMELRRFLAYDIVGAGLWSALFCLLGYFFWQSLDTVEKYIGAGAAAFTGLVVVVLAIVFAVRLRRDPEMRARLQRRLDASPAWRRVRGPLTVPLGPPEPGPPRARADDAAGARGRRLLHVLLARRRCSAPRRSSRLDDKAFRDRRRVLRAGRRRHPQRPHAPRLAAGDADRRAAHRGLGDPHAQRHARGRSR